jgi:2,5-diketo-D-gluconate reductase A
MGRLANDLELIHGARIPRIGFGTGRFSSDEAEVVVAQAIGAGYRLIDTAFNYKNEYGVGRGIVASGVPRQEIFVTTKFNRESHGVEFVREAWASSVEQMGLDYVDLLLIHWPNPKYDRYVDAWRGLKSLLDEGLVRAIGVANFKPAHLQRLLDETGVTPDVNQVQVSPYFPRYETVAFHQRHGIVTESHSPLGSGKGLLAEPALMAKATSHGRTPAQIVLRWHLQRGLVPIPKTQSLNRMRENLDVYDFELSSADLEVLAALEKDESGAIDSDRAETNH